MVETILDIFFTVVLIAAALVGSAYFWQWFYSHPTRQDETVFFRADDGWRLAIHRYRCAGNAVGLPVILCHGLASNRRSFDLPEGPSLARFLRDHGRDVWVAELRGSGMSDSPGLRRSEVPYSWSFEDHLKRDVPAIIQTVLDRTAAAGVHWVGHSMGGMLILAHLGTHAESRIASATTIGSPVDFSEMQTRSYKLLLKAKWVAKVLPIFPLPFLGKLAVPLAHKVPRLFLGPFHPPNVEPAVARRILAIVSEVLTPSKLWLDFGRFVERQSFEDPNGTSYLERLEDSNVPLLVTGGSRDQMAPPSAVSAACGSPTQSRERTCLTLGRAAGCKEDYGHLDLIMGIRTETEFFPKILEWLATHDRPFDASSTAT